MILAQNKAKDLISYLKEYLSYCKKIDNMGIPELNRSRAYNTTQVARRGNLCEGRDLIEKRIKEEIEKI